jgi:hypothetical protein
VAEQSLTVARSSGDITPEWLSGVLGLGGSKPVTGLDLSLVGTGQMGSLVRAELEFTATPGDHVPTSVVIKLAAESPDVRGTCAATGLSLEAGANMIAPLDFLPLVLDPQEGGATRRLIDCLTRLKTLAAV